MAMRLATASVLLLACAVASFPKITHLTQEERAAKITSVLSDVKMPATMHERRRLIETHGKGHADANESFESIVDERSFHFHRSKSILTLKNMGFEDHELPETAADSLVPEFHLASERMMRRLMEAEKDYKVEMEARAKHRALLATEARSSLDDAPTGPRYLRQEAPGVHRVAIDGRANEEHVRSLLEDITDSGVLGTCNEVSNGYVYSIDGGFSGQTPFGMMAAKTPCTCGPVKSATRNALSSKVEMPGRWCQCKENEKHISFTTYTCDKYPGLVRGSECTIDTETFPKAVRCDFKMALADMMSIDVATEFKIGYGPTGDEEDLVVEFSAGVTTNQIPMACPIAPLIGGFPNIPGYMLGTSPINAVMAFCNLMSYAADKAIELQPAMDIGQTLMGGNGQGAIDLVPFHFKFPPAQDSMDPNPSAPLQRIARIPLTTNAAADGADVSGVSFSSGPVCLSDIGGKMKQGGGAKRPLQAIGVALGMVGADFCFEMPGLDTTSTDLIFGLKMSVKSFDKTTVDFNKFIDLLPNAWNTMTKSLTGGAGVKDLMLAALNVKPLASCPSAVCGEYVDISLGSKLTELITEFFPEEQTKQDIDIGEIIGQVAEMKSIMKDGKYFKFPNMFKADAAGRRLLSTPRQTASSTPIIHQLAAGPIDAQGSIVPPEQHARRLASTLPVKYKNYLLDGSQCTLTVDSLPKKVNCLLKLKLASLELDLTTEFVLSYDLNGVDMVIITRMKIKLMAGSLADYGDVASKELLASIDIGGLIDDSLAGTISIMPLGIEFPKEGMFEIARVPVKTLKENGACMTNMEKLAPESQKNDAKQVSDVIKNVVGFFGGDVCSKSPGLDVTDGFKLDVNGVMSIFNKSMVDVYPIIDTIKNVEPSTSSVISAIQSVFGDQIKEAMNTAVKAILPESVDFTVNVGKLIAAAGDEAKAAGGFAGDKLPVRRLLATTPVGQAGDDGVFNMGAIPASANPASVDSGDASEMPSNISPAAEQAPTIVVACFVAAVGFMLV
jgi:hypothetical protein